MNKFKEWIFKKKPKFYIFEEEGQLSIGFGFKPKEDGFVNDGWYFDKNDIITVSIFEDSDEFHEEASGFLSSVPGLGFEIGSCTYSLEDEVKTVNFLIENGFKEGIPAWL